MNNCVESLELVDNDLGTKDAQAIGEALKVNCSLKKLYLFGNKINAIGTRALLDALQVNGSLTDCILDEYQNRVEDLCERNVAMYKRVAESIVHLLALRRMRKIIWIPIEMMVMLGRMLWKTRCDINVWNK